MPPGLTEIRGSALWHFHDYALPEKSFTLRRVSEPQYRDASFLDQRIESDSTPAFRYGLEHLEKLFPAPAVPRRPTMFIFHIGHCGSTLLSRALGASETTLPVREPLTLRHLAEELRSQQAGGDPGAWNARLFTVLQGLSRSFRPGQVPVVKATSVCNNLLLPVLRENSQPRAVLMHVTLEAWLAGMLGKQQEPLDLRGHAAARLRDWTRLGGAPPIDPDERDPAKLAVLAWLTGMHFFTEAQSRLPERVLLLDFEDFLRRPAAGLAAVGDFFGLGEATETIIRAWPRVSSGYSKKPDHPYTAANREQILERGRKLRQAEIRSGLDWAEKLLAATPALQALRAFLDAST